MKDGSCQHYVCSIISGAKKYDMHNHISSSLKELNWLAIENSSILEVPFWHFNVGRAQQRIILRLNLLNNSTSVGGKLETHHCYIFPYLNRQVAREASITEQ